MDPVHTQKLKAMNKYKKSQFFNSLIFYCFTTLTFCSIPFWLPSLYSSTKVFLLVSVPNTAVLIFNPKCLFLVCNIIVVFLIGESKLVSKNSSPDTDIYDEYVKRSSSLRTHVKRSSSLRREEKEVKESKVVEMSMVEENEKIVRMVEEEEEGEEEVKEEKGDGEKEDIESEQVEDLNGKEEEEVALPAEELNKKVEEFIAKINNQRRLEAKLLICSNSSS